MESVKKNAFFKILLWIALLITVFGFLVDLQTTFTYIGADLRTRVVGARLVLEGIDPYFFKWDSSWSDKFYDPMQDPYFSISRVSVPPTVLALHSIMARLSYVYQKILWLIVQWSAFLGTVFIFYVSNTSRIKTTFILIVSFFLPTVYFGVFI